MSRLEHKGDGAYGAVARLLHWVIVLLVALLFVVGWIMPDVRHDTRPVGLIAWHLGIGATLLAAMAIRIAWRITHRPPPHTLSPALAAASRGTHFLLYLALVAVPLLGWANASSRGWPVKLFGAAPLPALTSAGSQSGHVAGDVHGALAWALFALIAIHVAAALFHRYVLKDRVMQRMMP